jgi:hypothetical protein
MSRLSLVSSAVSLAAAAGALTLAACSDSPLSPTSSLKAGAASASVTPGTNSFTIVSDASTLFCTGANGDYTIPSPTFTAAGCVSGSTVDLTSALNTYNPGWSQPFTGSSWIGFNAKGGTSNEYRANPGRYVYQESFTIPSGVTSPVLDIHVKADNVAAVYLNGKLVGAQDNTDCNPDVPTCNWNSDLHIVDNTAADFNIGAANTLTFLVIDLPTGAFSSDPAVAGTGAPQFGCAIRQPQDHGTVGYTSTTVTTVPNHVVSGGGTGVAITNLGAANQAGCENPTGLDFAGTVSWTATVLQWCSPGFWKTHTFWVAQYNTAYSNLPSTRAALKSGSPSNPSILQVVSAPAVYGGPATNSVADYLSGIYFPNNTGTSADDANCNGGVVLQ